jgi:hypothetical protein
MTLIELKGAHAAGRLTKPQFIETMHARHCALHEYAAALAGTEVERIELAEGEVVMTMRPDGLRFLVDPQDWRTAPVEVFNFGRYEGVDGDALMALAEGAGTALDIGANVGFHDLRIARRNPGCTAHAFEPIPRTFAQLQPHLDLNRTARTPSGFAAGFGFTFLLLFAFQRHAFCNFYYLTLGMFSVAAEASGVSAALTISINVISGGAPIRIGGPQ